MYRSLEEPPLGLRSWDSPGSYVSDPLQESSCLSESLLLPVWRWVLALFWHLALSSLELIWYNHLDLWGPELWAKYKSLPQEVSLPLPFCYDNKKLADGCKCCVFLPIPSKGSLYRSWICASFTASAYMEWALGVCHVHPEHQERSEQERSDFASTVCLHGIDVRFWWECGQKRSLSVRKGHTNKSSNIVSEIYQSDANLHAISSALVGSNSKQMGTSGLRETAVSNDWKKTDWCLV